MFWKILKKEFKFILTPWLLIRKKEIVFMRASQNIFNTLRDNPADASLVSHRLLLRAGLAHKLGIGLYHILPLGLRVIRKIEVIVREEMNAVGALEIQMPILAPAELWQKSKRWDNIGKELFRIKDRHENWAVLGPTHEESVTHLLSHLFSSYKELPKNVYQINTKFRDEIRPRFGMMRAREFIMKDGYSFHTDSDCLENCYQSMRKAYRRIFMRMGLDTIIVEADSGTMGGKGSEEFMVPADVGEETLLISENSSYRSNQEKTPLNLSQDIVFINDNSSSSKGNSNVLEKIETPNQKTIIDIAKFLKLSPDQILKTVIYEVSNESDNEVVLVFLRGDRDVNEVKLRTHLQCEELIPARIEVQQAKGFEVGFVGPHNLPSQSRVLWDHSIKTRSQFVIGANEKDTHYTGFVPGTAIETHDLALARDGDPAPNGDGKLKEMKGIEVAHIFKLGQKYSKDFGMQVLDEKGASIIPWMGCYGIGINRSMAAIIEQCHDEKGICWPISVAPYEFVLIGITKTAQELKEVENLYLALVDKGCEVLWDDRDVRPGVKFADAELIGFPLRITMGHSYFDSGVLELKFRVNAEERKLKGDISKISDQIIEIKNELLKCL